MIKKKTSPSNNKIESDLVKQITAETLPKPELSPSDPAAAINAISDWDEEWLAIVEVEKPKMFALSKQLEGFIERTNYLAWWCESIGIDSSPLIQFAHDARETYFAFRPTLPPVPDSVRVLLDRLKFRVQPIQSQPFDLHVKDRLPIPADEANFMVKKHLEQHPKATTREIAKAVGIAHGRVSEMPAWKAEKVRRAESKVHAPIQPRQLTKQMLNAIQKGADPAAVVEAKDAAWQKIFEKADSQSRAKLTAMTPKEREKLVNLALDQFREDMEDGESEACS